MGYYLSLLKAAAPVPQEDGEYRPYTLGEKVRNIAPSALLGMLPFVSHLGKLPNIHQGKGQLVDDIEAFRKMVRPGDIMLSGSKKISPQQIAIALASGNPEGYHVAVMDRARSMREHGSTPEGGFEMSDLEPSKWKRDNLQLLRPKDPTYAKKLVTESRKLNGATEKFRSKIENAMLRKGYSASEAYTLSYVATSKLYRWGDGVASGVKEVYAPNARIDKAKANKQLKATEEFIRNHKSLANPVAEKLHELRQAEKATAGTTAWSRIRRWLFNNSKTYKKVVDKVPGLSARLGLYPELPSIGKYNELRQLLPQGVGGVCSTVPAILGRKNIVPGKSPAGTMPADYLRSTHFEPVARFRGGARNDTFGKVMQSALNRAPLAMRLIPAVGLGALGISGMKRHFARQKEEDAMRQQSIDAQQQPQQTIKAAVEKLIGGLGDNKKDSSFNKKELGKGVSHELEHTGKRSIAKEIAKDHLSERKDYYSALAKSKLG